MKYLSLVVVVIFIAFTWWFAQQTGGLSAQQINKMENIIADYLAEAMMENQPNIQEVEFDTLRTESLESGRKMRVHFNLSYLAPNDQGQMERVHREGSFMVTSEDGDKWKAQIEQAGDTKVEFLEPFEIYSDGSVPQGEPAEETADEGENSPEAE
ncbi:MAG: hypothetical protein KDD33_03190 [Bdellovibrionales bacterium]|nr:hypothetical protein [Bdellovibrionales bacterium]